jgi:hypothetical protein
LATYSEKVRRVRREEDCGDNEESQLDIRSTGAQDSESEGDSDESDQDSEVWEDAEDAEWNGLQPSSDDRHDTMELDTELSASSSHFLSEVCHPS